MDLTRSLVEARAREYEEEEPLYTVEAEAIETLPDAFASGEFGWRDAEWVVRWHYRRYLGDYPDDRRRAAENAFGENDLGTIRSVVEDVVSSTGTAEKVERLTDLAGVDVEVSSAFLAFVEPRGYIVVGEREWAVLLEAGELSRPYPDDPSVDAYERYLGNCRSLAARFDCDLWTLYRAIWRLHPGRSALEWSG